MLRMSQELLLVQQVSTRYLYAERYALLLPLTYLAYKPYLFLDTSFDYKTAIEEFDGVPDL